MLLFPLLEFPLQPTTINENNIIKQLGYTEVDYLTQASALSVASIVIETVHCIYEELDQFEEIKTRLDKAKENIKKLTSEYQNDNHLNELTAYYSSVLSYYEFCFSPSGSFSSLKTTMTNFEQQANTYKNKLRLYFE